MNALPGHIVVKQLALRAIDPYEGIPANDSHVAVALLARVFAIPRKALLDGLEVDDGRQGMHRRMHHNLRFCTDCMEMAYHSVMHQRVDASRCPHHGVMLEDTCRGCGTTAPYQLNARLLGSPFRATLIKPWRARTVWIDRLCYTSNAAATGAWAVPAELRFATRIRPTPEERA